MLKIHYYKAIWIQNGLKEQRKQHINVMEFFTCISVRRIRVWVQQRMKMSVSVCLRCGLNVSSTAAKHHVEALTSSGLVFGDDTFIIRFDEIMKMGPSCEARGRIRRESIEERPCDDTGGRWPSTGQEESSHQNPTMLTP